MIQAHPANRTFTNVGEIGMVFSKNAYTRQSGVYPPDIIGYAVDNDEEGEVRIDLAAPDYRQIFNYVTVFDPNGDDLDNDGDGFKDRFDVVGPELKIAGRININTAPWFVIAQLPWVSLRETGYDSGTLARAIVAYRDRLDLTALIPPGPDYSARPGPLGFRSIGELMQVPEIRSLYGSDGVDQAVGSADLTPADEAPDDFEERDLIFARISNLVTVRSDVFTAYILVRIGTDGPQKRVIAILDRSDVYGDALGNVLGRVRIRALHPVPDPR
jgi:hypothetical protein